MANVGSMAADAFAVALATERTRTARLFNLFRFVGVSAFFALTLLMGVGLENPGWVNNDWILFAAYWVASGVLLCLAYAPRRSPAGPASASRSWTCRRSSYSCRRPS